MHILIIEDNMDIAANVAAYLEQKGHTTDFAYDGVTGLHFAVSGSFDVIILDLLLPGIGGLEVCRKLREESDKTTPVLMLTACDKSDDTLAGFNVGADDYMVKPFSLQELEARLLALHRRVNRGLSRKLRVADLEYDLNAQVVTRAGHRVKLKPTARRLLEILMRDTHRVCAREELERAVWGDALPDSDLLRVHIYEIRNAIDKPFSPPLLHTVHRVGYRLAEPGYAQEDGA